MYDRNYLITMALMGFFLTVSLFYLAATTDAFSSRNNTAREDFLLPVFEAIPEQTVNCVICHIQDIQSLHKIDSAPAKYTVFTT